MAVGIRAFVREQLSANAARLGDEVVACHDLADREGARGGLHVRVVPFQPECSKAGEKLSASSCSSTYSAITRKCERLSFHGRAFTIASNATRMECAV
ncbi:uncharacterized protein N7525_008927 [Penicillium rubens]|uniref:uncharacterized protein n=1 Tax=Penicillium rubens TaxID=1108849 RepID=UPI002A5ADBB7|nr:uncharacterized protein N7525_008927 [Penicillium rubens]KAJ5830674.1 hypothetical protein N7525_008927 [Penicillium rubens]KAJ5854254.1 hypothetical protein N7534_006797 [Penicillium rubens]